MNKKGCLKKRKKCLYEEIVPKIKKDRLDSYMPCAGVLVFIHNSAVPRVQKVLEMLNRERVSDEVLKLFLVIPRYTEVYQLCQQIRSDPAFIHLENIDAIEPNNLLRGVMYDQRLRNFCTGNYHLLVNLETVNPVFRHKYPVPNLTIPAGGMNPGETLESAAQRELQEETCIYIDTSHFIKHMFRGRMHLFTVVVSEDTDIYVNKCCKGFIFGTHDLDSCRPVDVMSLYIK